FFKWEPNFDFKSDPTTLPTWISFPGLPVNFYEEDYIKSIAGNIGPVLRVHEATIARTNTTAAVVCVELDIKKPRKERIWINYSNQGFWQYIDYGRMPSFCELCHRLVHLKETCNRNKKKAMQSQPTEVIVNNPLQAGGYRGHIDEDGFQMVKRRKNRAVYRPVQEVNVGSTEGNQEHEYVNDEGTRDEENENPDEAPSQLVEGLDLAITTHAGPIGRDSLAPLALEMVNQSSVTPSSHEAYDRGLVNVQGFQCLPQEIQNSLMDSTINFAAQQDEYLWKPSKLGGGGVIRDTRGQIVFAFAHSYDVSSSLMAECRALLDGLRCVKRERERGATSTNNREGQSKTDPYWQPRSSSPRNIRR
ncbi:hypothetical protein Taro_027289, partial [Colocasia esculenta]|nr:hypothetical protein [Colocasia esculenta]